jgi:uncharacterized protein (TIGR03067 family)
MEMAVLSFVLMTQAPVGRFAVQDVPQSRAEQALQRDVKALQGAWALVAYEHEGKRYVPAEVAGDFEEFARRVALRIKGEKLLLGKSDGRNEFILRRSGKSRDKTVWLEPVSKPKRFDISFGQSGGVFGVGLLTFTGIYRLRGEQLEVCCTLQDQEPRPKTFAAPKDHEWRWLLIYRRVKSPGK